MVAFETHDRSARLPETRQAVELQPSAYAQRLLDRYIDPYVEYMRNVGRASGAGASHRPMLLEACGPMISLSRRSVDNALSR